MKLIRKTKSVCPECFKMIDAFVVEENGKIYMDKECDKHGKFKLLLSFHPKYYKYLSDFYFSLISQSFPQKDYIVHLTNKCNLNCPICLANANVLKIKDYPFASLKKFLKGKKGFKIDLMGSEPTEREDLPEIIEEINKTGNIAALHTNGIRLSDFDYLKRLKRSGLKEIHLQFDGFDDYVYEKIRGKKLLNIKLAVLENLEKLNISTDLVVTIVRGLNEKEMVKVLDYGVKHDFVKEVFFLGCRFLGKAKALSIDNCMMPDELIDILESQTKGRISRANIFKFQKLYYSFLAAFSIRKCFYIQHFLITRHKNDYIPVDKIFNLEGIQKRLNKFRQLRTGKSRWSFIYFIYTSILLLIQSRNFGYLKEFLSFGLPFIRGFDLSKLSKKNILLGFISACDAYSIDYEIAQNCGKGAISTELGIQDAGAIDNVLRDELMSAKVN